MTYVCKHCSRALQSKASHERHEANCKLNPANKEAPANTPVKSGEPPPGKEAPPAGEAEGLEIVKPAGAAEAEKETWKCGNCNAQLEKAEECCPVCGIFLKWS